MPRCFLSRQRNGHAHYAPHNPSGRVCLCVPFVKKALSQHQAGLCAPLVTRGLALEGVRAEAISGEQAPGERAGVVARFREGRVHVLIATDLLARGIDFLNVRTVVNYDFPLSPIDYVHRCAASARRWLEPPLETVIARCVQAAARGMCVKVRKGRAAE